MRLRLNINVNQIDFNIDISQIDNKPPKLL